MRKPTASGTNTGTPTTVHPFDPARQPGDRRVAAIVVDDSRARSEARGGPIVIRSADRAGVDDSALDERASVRQAGGGSRSRNHNCRTSVGNKRVTNGIRADKLRDRVGRARAGSCNVDDWSVEWHQSLSPSDKTMANPPAASQTPQTSPCHGGFENSKYEPDIIFRSNDPVGETLLFPNRRNREPPAWLKTDACDRPSIDAERIRAGVVVAATRQWASDPDGDTVL